MNKLRVLKLGGSQLESPDCIQRLKRWVLQQTSMRTLMLAGGGPPVDAIRQLALQTAYDPVFLHWLCIDAMDISFRLVEQQLKLVAPDWNCLRTSADLQTWLNEPEIQTAPSTGSTSGLDSLRLALVHISAFYTSENHRHQPLVLPLGWETTSDSLAALLATVTSADELVLIKSCRVDPAWDWDQLAQAGIVDQAFPQAVRYVPSVRLIQL